MDKDIDGIVKATIQAQNLLGRTMLLIGAVCLVIFLLSGRQLFSDYMFSSQPYKTSLLEAKQLIALQDSLQKRSQRIAKFTSTLRQYEEIEETARQKATANCGKCEAPLFASDKEILKQNRTMMLLIWVRQLQWDPVETMDFRVASRALHGLRNPDDPSWGDHPGAADAPISKEIEAAARYIGSDAKIPEDSQAYSLVRQLQSEDSGAQDTGLSEDRLNQLQVALRTLASYCEMSEFPSCDRQAVENSLTGKSAGVPTYKTPFFDVALDANFLLASIPMALIPLQVYALILLARLGGLHRLSVRTKLNRHNIWHLFDPISHRYHSSDLYGGIQRFILGLALSFPMMLSALPFAITFIAVRTLKESVRWSKSPLDKFLSSYSEGTGPWWVFGTITALSACLVVVLASLAAQPRNKR